MEHLDIQIVQQQEKSEGRIQLISAPTFVPHSLLPSQTLVDLQQGITLAGNSTHRGKSWPHNGGDWILVSY